MIIQLTRFMAKSADDAKTFRRMLSGFKASVPDEPGNLASDVYAADDDPLVLFSLESWENQSAAEDHLAHLKFSGAYDTALTLFSAPPFTTTLNPIEPSSVGWKSSNLGSG